MLNVTGSQNSNLTVSKLEVLISQLCCDMETKFTIYGWHIFMTAVEILYVQLYESETCSLEKISVSLFQITSWVTTATEAFNSFRCTWLGTAHKFLAVWAMKIPLLLLWSCAQEAATTFPIIFWLCIGMPIRYNTNTLHCCPITSEWPVELWGVQQATAQIDFRLIESAVRIEIKTSNTAFQNCISFIQQNLH